MISVREGGLEAEEIEKPKRKTAEDTYEATSETAIGHREKRNQLFKEHNRLLRISAFPFGYVTSEIVGVVQRKLNGFLVVSIIM